jgi:hypothetical protein
MTRIILGVLTAAAIVLPLALVACTPAELQEACAVDKEAQPIIVPVEGAVGLAVLPAVPFIAAGHIAAGVGCAVVSALPAKP